MWDSSRGLNKPKVFLIPKPVSLLLPEKAREQYHICPWGMSWTNCFSQSRQQEKMRYFHCEKLILLTMITSSYPRISNYIALAVRLLWTKQTFLCAKQGSTRHRPDILNCEAHNRCKSSIWSPSPPRHTNHRHLLRQILSNCHTRSSKGTSS